MSEKPDPDHAEHDVAATKGERIKRHCMRRWWMWLIGFIIFHVVIVIIIIFGIIPPVAQKTLDKSTLHIESISIREPSPHAFQFSVTSYITSSSSIAHKATLDPMTVQFYLKDQDPFMYLPLPGVHGGDKIVVETLNHTTEIANQTAFGIFAGTLMNTVNFDMGIWGKTKLHLGAIKTNVKYREWVNLKGFDKLNGMVIISYGLAKSGAYGFEGKVVIPNPTVFTLELGDVLLDLKLKNETLGNGILPNLTITPGLKNVYDFKSNLTLDSAIKLATGEPTLQVRATDVQNGGVSIPWLAGPLGAVTIDVPINKSYVL